VSARRATRRLRLGLVTVSVLAVGLGLAGPAGAEPVTAAPLVATGGLPDPGDSGPSAVTVTEYNDGDTAFTPPGFPGPVEVRASVHYPTGLSGGERPLIVLMHGRHSTCFSGSSSALEWPCTGGRQTIPSFQGYNYLAQNLASWGYLVVSVSANGINARDNSVTDLGMLARAQLIQKHLDKWQTFSTAGGAPFGTLFVGKVDMDNIGTMGHSRGGEGVAQHFVLNESLGSPYGITAVLPLAPVDFNRPIVDDVALSVILPYCDGDVSDLQGAHFYDDALYTSPGDATPKYMQEMLGANHNHFNTIWTPGGWPAGTFDDTSCSSIALTAPQQRNVGEAYMAGFLRLHLGGPGAEPAFKAYFDGTSVEPASSEPADTHTSYHAPAADRRDVNRWKTSADLTTNRLGGAVTRKNLTPFDLCGGEAPQPQHCLGVSTSQQPHTVASARSSKRGLSQLRYGWTSKRANLVNIIPGASGDVSGFETLTFRIARNFADGRNPAGQARDLNVQLTDGSGGKKSVKVSAFSDALFAQPTAGFGLPKLVLNTVRLPLSSFTGVDLTDVSKITFKHNAVPSGAVLHTDLAFTDPS